MTVFKDCQSVRAEQYKFGNVARELTTFDGSSPEQTRFFQLFGETSKRPAYVVSWLHAHRIEDLVNLNHCFAKLSDLR